MFNFNVILPYPHALLIRIILAAGAIKHNLNNRPHFSIHGEYKYQSHLLRTVLRT